MPPGPCILIGSGKYLRFKNVTIQASIGIDGFSVIAYLLMNVAAVDRVSI